MRFLVNIPNLVAVTVTELQDTLLENITSQFVLDLLDAVLGILSVNMGKSSLTIATWQQLIQTTRLQRIRSSLCSYSVLTDHTGFHWCELDGIETDDNCLAVVFLDKCPFPLRKLGINEVLIKKTFLVLTKKLAGHGLQMLSMTIAADVDAKMLDKLLAYCPLLISLTLCDNKGCSMSNDHLLSIGYRCPQLMDLMVVGAGRVTDKGVLSMLRKYSGKHMNSLRFRKCRDLSSRLSSTIVGLKSFKCDHLDLLS